MVEDARGYLSPAKMSKDIVALERHAMVRAVVAALCAAQ